MVSQNSEQILFTQKGKNSLFFIGEEESPAAYISFKHKNDNVIIAEHTVVSEALRGKGIASKLAVKLMDYARENDLKIVPVCSYVVGFFEKHTTYSDLLANND